MKPIRNIAISQRLNDPPVILSELLDTLIEAARAWNVPAPNVISFGGLNPPASADASIFFTKRLPAGSLGYHTKNRAGYISYCTFDPRYYLEVVYHEALEMLIDPDGNKFQEAPTIKGVKGFPPTVHYLVEICDPVERTPKAFITPEYYAAPYLEPGGYVSFTSNGIWYQAFASSRGRISVRKLGTVKTATRAERDRLLRQAKKVKK